MPSPLLRCAGRLAYSTSPPSPGLCWWAGSRVPGGLLPQSARSSSLAFSVSLPRRLHASSPSSKSSPVGEAVAQAVGGVSLSWATVRASGLVAFLAATGAIVLGARGPARLPLGGLSARVYALHRALGIAAVLATAVHLVSLWLDEFIEFTVSQLVLVPWTSSYEPFGMTLGWLAMLFLILAASSGALRRLLPGWRVVHTISYLTFALGLVHGLLAGTDAGSPLALAFYLATLLMVGWATYLRFFSSKPPRRSDTKREPAVREPDRDPSVAYAAHHQ